MDPIQNPLFKEPVGSLFKARREQMGLSPEEVAKRLKFSTHMVEAIESEHWEKLGAPIYAKSYITGYIRLLGLDESIRDEIPSLQSEPPLKALTATRIEPDSAPSRWWALGLGVVLLAALLAYLNGRRQAPAESPSLDALITAAAPVRTDAASPASVQQTVAVPAQAPAATPAQKPAAAGKELQLRNSRESWVEIRAADNAVLYSGLIPAGQEFRHGLDKAARITLGNASTAEVSIGGQRHDMAPVLNNDVARFTLGADGQPTPAEP